MPPLQITLWPPASTTTRAFRHPCDISRLQAVEGRFVALHIPPQRWNDISSPLLCRRHDPVRFLDSTVDLDNTSYIPQLHDVFALKDMGTRSSLHRHRCSLAPSSRFLPQAQHAEDLLEHVRRNVQLQVCRNTSRHHTKAFRDRWPASRRWSHGCTQALRCQ